MTTPELLQLRVAIDEVDHKILELVADRRRIVLRVGEIKRERGIDVYDPERERAVLERLGAAGPAPLDASSTRQVFERLIDVSRRLEKSHMERS